MTEQELLHTLSIMTTNYGRQIDDNLVALWKGLFMSFDARFFARACVNVMTKNKFFPNAAELIEAYEAVKAAKEREQNERLRLASQARADEQAYCHLCNNGGLCIYTRTVHGHEYEFGARCVCLHGRNLNRFSQPQIDRDSIPELRDYYNADAKAQIRAGKNPFYLPTVKETLGDKFEAFAALRAKELSKNNLYV